MKPNNRHTKEIIRFSKKNSEVVDKRTIAALEAGPLQTEEYKLPEEVQHMLKEHDFGDTPAYMIEELVKYYFANKQDETAWVVLPVTNIDFYFGDSTFSHKYKSRLPKDLFIMESVVGGVCRYKLCDNLIRQ